MSCLVTGAAGFIGSHLSESLIDHGYRVTGVDCFRDYYPRAVKRSNISELNKERRFKMVDADLATSDLAKLDPPEQVFHLAAQAGVRGSWGDSFSVYVRDNITATQRLLEAAKRWKVKKLVYASSSSIYGDSERFPTPEEASPRPVSPYGATKLTAEHLCRIYSRQYGVPAVVLRYFTVYGPRQRPDMAFHKFIDKISRGEAIEVYGDGEQLRDFTYVGDTVKATLLAREAIEGRVYNVGSGRPTRLRDALEMIERKVGKKAKIKRSGPAAGDVRDTSADISRIHEDLGYAPSTTLEAGLARQVEWQLAKRYQQRATSG